MDAYFPVLVALVGAALGFVVLYFVVRAAIVSALVATDARRAPARTDAAPSMSERHLYEDGV